MLFILRLKDYDGFDMGDVANLSGYAYDEVMQILRDNSITIESVPIVITVQKSFRPSKHPESITTSDDGKKKTVVYTTVSPPDTDAFAEWTKKFDGLHPIFNWNTFTDSTVQVVTVKHDGTATAIKLSNLEQFVALAQQFRSVSIDGYVETVSHGEVPIFYIEQW